MSPTDLTLKSFYFFFFILSIQFSWNDKQERLRVIQAAHTTYIPTLIENTKMAQFPL